MGLGGRMKEWPCCGRDSRQASWLGPWPFRSERIVCNCAGARPTGVWPRFPHRELLLCVYVRGGATSEVRLFKW